MYISILPSTTIIIMIEIEIKVDLDIKSYRRKYWEKMLKNESYIVRKIICYWIYRWIEGDRNNGSINDI